MTMKRRQFIKTAAAATLPVFLDGMPVSALLTPSLLQRVDPYSDRVLVLIQLNGGNDGLNTIFPLDQYDHLALARPNLIIPRNQLIPVSDTVGFHPRLTGIKELFDEGRLGIVQSVGYPGQNRSHFRSMEIWSTASASNEFLPTGWFGRFLDQQFPGFPDHYPNATFADPFAIALGRSVSETCQGAAANFSITLTDPFAQVPLEEGMPPDQMATIYDQELAFLQSTISQTNAYGKQILDAARKGSNAHPYPGSRLAQQLKIAALLIAGGLKTRIYVVSLGEFDTHSRQAEPGEPATGRHATLLGTLAEAVNAFQQDLKKLGQEERVLGMTFSEFGRQIKSNGSFGTDHGTAAPLLLFGSCVNPQILGSNPQIPREVEDQAGVPMQYDFRDVYGSVLFSWFGLPDKDIRTLLYPEFRRLPVIKECSSIPTGNRQPRIPPFRTYNYPNPFTDSTVIFFHSDNEWVELSVFDNRGNRIKVLFSGKVMQGEHQVPFDSRDLPPGPYFYRLQKRTRQETVKMVKAR